MPFNGSGVYQRVRNWVADATAGIKIRADYHDAEDDGFAAGLTNCITRDGQSIVTQNIPWNSKRITGLADPVNPQDAATKASVDAKVAAGGTLTGDLTIDKDNPTLILDKNASGQSSAISGRLAGVQRWLMRLGNDVAETGANAGSDFDLHRYADDGTYLGLALGFSRATGLGTVAGDPTAATGIATKGYVDARDDAVSGLRVLKAGDTMTGLLTTAASADLATGGAVGSIQVIGNTNNAAMSFHRPGAFACNFGLGSDGNFWFGGWSHGASTYRLWSTRDFASLPTGSISGIRWLHAGASYPPGAASGVWQDPFPNSVIYLYSVSGGTVIQGFQHKYLQAFTSSWYTIGS